MVSYILWTGNDYLFCTVYYVFLNCVLLLFVFQSSEGSFSAAPGVEEELQQLKAKLQEEETASRTLQERLEASTQLLTEKEQGHAEQVCLVLLSFVSFSFLSGPHIWTPYWDCRTRVTR